MISSRDFVSKIDAAFLSHLQPLLSSTSIPFFASNFGTNPPVFLGKFKYYRKVSSLISAIFYTVYYRMVSLFMLERVENGVLTEDQLVSTMRTVMEIMNVHIDHPYELEDSQFIREYMYKIGNITTSSPDNFDELFDQIKEQVAKDLYELNCNPTGLDVALLRIFQAAIQGCHDTTNN